MIFQEWQLTPQRVALHQPTATAVASDLHLGYQEARRRSGDAVPLVDSAMLLAPLFLALQETAARHLVIAGDLFERAFDASVWHDFKKRLDESGVHFLGLIPGNHDRGLESVPAHLPLLRQGLALGDWHVLHGDGRLPETPVLLGHFHPCVSIQGRKFPCYVAGTNRLVLPAYSREAAGTSVNSVNLWQGCRRLAIIAGNVMDAELLI